MFCAIKNLRARGVKSAFPLFVPIWLKVGKAARKIRSLSQGLHHRLGDRLRSASPGLIAEAVRRTCIDENNAAHSRTQYRPVVVCMYSYPTKMKNGNNETLLRKFFLESIRCKKKEDVVYGHTYLIQHIKSPVSVLNLRSLARLLVQDEHLMILLSYSAGRRSVQFWAVRIPLEVMFPVEQNEPVDYAAHWRDAYDRVIFRWISKGSRFWGKMPTSGMMACLCHQKRSLSSTNTFGSNVPNRVE